MNDIPELYQNVERLLRVAKLPEVFYKKKSKGIRHTFGVVPFCFVYQRPPALSSISKKKPELYKALRELGDRIVPFAYDAITVNINNQMGPHKDKHNNGDGVIVTGGDYTGGALVVEGVPQQTRYTPICFNGAEREHWVEPFQGFRYSLIFYKTIILDKWRGYFPEDANDPLRDYSLMDVEYENIVYDDEYNDS